MLTPPQLHPPLLAVSGPDPAPDPVLPQRDRLLDPGFAARRVEQLGLLDRTIDTATLVRAKYRIGESLRVLWRCTGPDRPATLVTVRAFAHASAIPLGADARPDPELAAAWWVFPQDRRLPDIRRIMAADPGLALELGLPAWRTSSVAEYAPERSLTVRAGDRHGATVAYLKSYAPATVDVERLAARYDLVAQWFDQCPGVVTPRVLATAGDVLAIEALPGMTWAASGSGATGSSAADHGLLHDLGRAIAHLHDLPVAATTGLSRPFGRLRADRVERSAELVARARPDVAEPLAALAARLRARPPLGEIVLLHGDCHPKNALVAPDGLALIDLDQAGWGDPGCDIASLVARLFHRAAINGHDRSRAGALARAFLTGYRRQRPLPPPTSLRWHLAATFVAEPAIRSVNRLHRAGLRHLAGTVELATAVLDGDLLGDEELEGLA